MATDAESLARTNMILGWPVLNADDLREPAQPVPLSPCGHPAWTCACKKYREPATREEDPADVQHEPVIEEGY